MPLSISNSQAPSFGNFLSTLLKDIGVCVKSGVFLCKLRLLGGCKRVSPHPEWVAGRRACRKIILCLRLKDGVQTNKTENVKMQRTVMKQEKEVWSHPQHALHLVGLRHTRDTEAQSRVSSRSRDGNIQPNTHQHLKWPKILKLKI